MCNKICCACVSIVVVIIAIAIAIYVLVPPIANYAELEKCPYCYGKTICAAFDDGEISATIFSRVNVINDKNVYYGEYNNVDIVIKKLGSSDELKRFDDFVCDENRLSNGCELDLIDDRQNYTKKIMDYMDGGINEFKPFKVCTEATARMLYDSFVQMKPNDVDEKVHLKNVWTILKINVEPLILQYLNQYENWPIPKYYGTCGRLAVMEHRGSHLLHKVNEPWLDRAYLALQLLQGAHKFTFGHPLLRFYLTDVSGDNIVVDDRLTLTFVDLENLVVRKDIYEETAQTSNIVHRSEIIHDPDGFAYTQEDLCTHSYSDHNYYAICSQLLSKDAPFPMIKNGFLHTPPVQVAYKYKEMFTLIEDCSDPGEKADDRFEAGRKIMDFLNQILSENRNKRNFTLKV